MVIMLMRGTIIIKHNRKPITAQAFFEHSNLTPKIGKILIFNLLILY